ncbi:YdeI/OmpD-associated family protein [Pedobacter sp. AW1-32]|uniref:YdeI/OmpD-associated family protein n=1 Tax=Pedobacter sp. AW1-32 TaxID=3383026 RepID=UPI003FF02543
MPVEFASCLAEDDVLKTAFDALTPGRQRAYLLYFSAPKRSKTRESRIEKCISAILEGRGLKD